MRRTFSAAIALTVGAALLAGCASGPRKPTSRQIARIERALSSAPGAAQPSTIVATEIAFARMARDEGQWTAFTHFAAEEGVLHGENGPIAAKPWLAQQSNPPKPVQWGPRTVWMSCDATLAISQGRFRDPEGKVGIFNTVWERQGDGTYRYLYDGGALDNPQPPPPPAGEEDEEVIVVTALDTVRGEVADCSEPGNPLPAAPFASASTGAESGGTRSGDGSLVWQWRQGANGSRQFRSFIWQGGEWQEAASFDFGARAGDAE